MKQNKKIENNHSFHSTGRKLIEKVQQAEETNRHEAEKSWQELNLRLGHVRPRRFRLVRLLAAAASLALLLSLGTYLWMETREEAGMSLALLESPTSTLPQNEIVLIEKQERMQLKDESAIQYDTQGKSNANEHAIKKEESSHDADKEAEEINQIIVPKGRRANITFSDGTRMYVNSGTRVVYPAIFKANKREILVEGEVYLEVQKDATRPFIVKTNQMDVKVLGTAFNVCAYKEDAAASVVLVNGSVEVKSGKRNQLLAPNQRLELTKSETTLTHVDVFEYICWKENMLLLNDRKAGEVFDRLARYYGRNVWYNEEVANIPISGKLDLRDSMDDVVQILCQSLFLKYKTDDNNNLIIKK